MFCQVSILILLAAPPDQVISCYSDFGPRVFASRNGSFGLKVLPPEKDRRSLGVFFRLNKDGNEQVIWRRQLVNVPGNVHISVDGIVVSIDTFPPYHTDHYLVIYDQKGSVIRDLNLADLLTEEELALADQLGRRVWLGDVGFKIDLELRDAVFFVKTNWARSALRNVKHVETLLKSDNPAHTRIGRTVMPEARAQLERMKRLANELDRTIRIDVKTGTLMKNE